MASSLQPRPSALLDLPPELRNNIYALALVHDTNIVISKSGKRFSKPGLLQTCRQIRVEATLMYYAHNSFTVYYETGLDEVLRSWLQTNGPQNVASLTYVGIQANIEVPSHSMTSWQIKPHLSTAEVVRTVLKCWKSIEGTALAPGAHVIQVLLPVWWKVVRRSEHSMNLEWRWEWLDVLRIQRSRQFEGRVWEDRFGPLAGSKAWFDEA